MLLIQIYQNPKVLNQDYAVKTFDMFLSNIGGYAGIIWQVTGLLFGWYSAFRFENDLGNSLYTKDKEFRIRESRRDDHKEEVEATIENKSKFTFSFWEYISL